MKYAVIKTGGKQYKVTKDEIIWIEKIEGEPKTKITFDEVFLVVDGEKIQIGTPVVKDAKVTGEIVEQFKDKKIRVFKFKAKSRYRKVKGHRQQLTKVKITQV